MEIPPHVNVQRGLAAAPFAIPAPGQKTGPAGSPCLRRLAPVGRDTPSRGSRPLAVPDRQPGLNACGAAVLMPEAGYPFDFCAACCVRNIRDGSTVWCVAVWSMDVR